MNINIEKKSANSIQELNTIGFRIGSEEYGLALSTVQEIITTPRITRVPKAPTYIKGVINLHGNVIPVIDIARRFKIGETKIGPGSRVVVIDMADEAIGLLAESVSKVASFSASQIQPPPPLVAGIAAEYLQGVVRLRNRFLIFLDLQKTLGEDDTN